MRDVGKGSVSQFINIGFDREGAANDFAAKIKGNGLKINLAIKNAEGKWVIHPIQARSVHTWVPVNDLEARRFQKPGIVIEFADQQEATDWLHLASHFMNNLYTLKDHIGRQTGDDELNAAIALASMLTDVAGIRMELE